jgi:serine/threonine protein kinase/Tol biopolymer transport system component
MAFAPGSHIGPYEVRSLLGAGSMGEVYRARDPRLARDVAIKVLPAASSADADTLRRFEQEARAAAALSHPNILAVYDVGTDDGVPFIVSELLEGETLRERLKRGRLRVAESLDYALQMARGLEDAHAKGIAHRDLKPENLFITTAGRVKILDFGIAKLTSPASPLPSGASGGYSTSSTTLTGAGLVLGTAGYMSPEQARGLAADHRSDIFAFGAIVYEMLSGTRAFRGETPADTLSAVLKDTPESLPAEAHIPVAFERIVYRCLEKNPAARFQSASDLVFALEGLSTISAAAVGTVSAATRGTTTRRLLPWALASVIALIAFTLGVLAYRPQATRATAPPIYRSSSLPPDRVTLSTASPAGGLALSPDGRRLVFTGRGPDDRVMLWVRSLDGLTAQALAGTDGAFYPFWSPDSQSIAFFAGGMLKKIDVAGGSTVTLCETPRPSILAAGGTWNRTGVILFAQATSRIYRVPDVGGTPAPATTLDEAAGETQHWAPFFLPDGRHFLFFAAGSRDRGPDDPNGVYVGSLDSNERTQILPGGSNAKYADGYLIFPRERMLVAQRFDTDRFELSGDVIPIADQIAVGGLSGRTGAFSVSDTGVLAYQAASGEVQSQLVWMDRAGTRAGTVGTPADYGDVELSPDQEEAAVSVLDAERRTRDIFMMDLARGLRTRFTFDPTDEQTASWSPDGTRVVYNARPKGYFDLYEKDASGVTEQTVLVGDSRNKTPLSWSRDGRWLLYLTGGLVIGNSDIWVMPFEGERTAAPFLQTPFNETDARFSPDGRWVAYVSNDTGSAEVYVTRFPGPAGKWPISASGGNYPRWRNDGRELYYVARDGRLMAASVGSVGQEFSVGEVRPLFELRANLSGRYPYDVSKDGQHFLVNTIVEAAAPSPITLVVNWASALLQGTTQ